MSSINPTGGGGDKFFFFAIPLQVNPPICFKGPFQGKL